MSTSAEGICDDCGRAYPTPWYADNHLWNRVTGSPDGCLCPSCFITRAESVLGPAIWKLSVELGRAR